MLLAGLKVAGLGSHSAYLSSDISFSGVAALTVCDNRKYALSYLVR